jgi:outer membrane protein assembly factor BamB
MTTRLVLVLALLWSLPGALVSCAHAKPAAVTAPAASPAAAAAPAAEGPKEPEPAKAPPLRWTLVAGDAGRTSVTEDAGPEETPGVLWSSLVATGQASEVVQAVAGEVRFLLMASGDDVLALDPATGKTRWSRAIGSIQDAAPVAVGARCVALGLEGSPHVLDSATGAVLKRLELDFLLQASPVVARGLAIFEETSASGMQGDSVLHALDPATLAEAWKASYPFGTGSLASADSERVYVGVADGVRAHVLADGKPAWHHAVERTMSRQGPSVAGGRVFIASGGLGHWNAEALDAATGAPIWKVTLGDRLSSPFATTPTELVFPLMGKALLRVSTKDGSVIGKVALASRSDVRPVVAARRIYLAQKKSVVALDAATWTERWRVDLDGDVSALSVVGDRLLAVRFDGFVTCIGR